MSIYLFHFLGKVFNLLFVSLVTLFNSYQVRILDLVNINNNLNKDTNVLTSIVNYNKEYVYNYKLPSGESNILQKGVFGINYNNGEEIINIQPASNEIIEVGTGKNGNFSGRLTGYGPDCPGCSSVGNVACFTENKKNHSLITDGIYYEDDEYGRVRILAASTYFSCGTIVEVKRGDYSFTAVVLDRGYDMAQAWKNGIVWMDLAYDSQASAASDGKLLGYNYTFKVKRWGW